MLSTVTSKGQITIPVEVRRAAGIEVGTQVEFIINTRKRIELVPRHHDIRSLRGAVPAPGRAVTLDAMESAIADGWSGITPTTPTTPATPPVPGAHEPLATYVVTPQKAMPPKRKP